MRVYSPIFSFTLKKISFYCWKTTLLFPLLLSFQDNKIKTLIPPGWNQQTDPADYIMGLFHLPKACILSIEADVPGPKIGNCIKTNVF